MITQRQANQLRYRNATVTTADLSAGPDEGASVGADTVAEVAHVRVGADDAGTLSAALAAVVGVPGERFKETVRAKPEFDFNDTTPADVDAATQVAVGKRGRQERGGKRITEWYIEDDVSEVNIINRPDMTPMEPGVREDEFLTVLAYNPSSSFTVSLADSTVRIPVQIGD